MMPSGGQMCLLGPWQTVRDVCIYLQIDQVGEMVSTKKEENKSDRNLRSGVRSMTTRFGRDRIDG